MITTFLLVPGAFCNAASWGPVARELTLRGHRAVALDLPGHGLDATVPVGLLHPRDPAALATARSGMAGVGTADDVGLVADAVRRAHQHGPVVLVGHSRGGLTVTAVANAVPELLGRLVYVSAWCCVAHTVTEYMAGPEHAGNGYAGLLAPVADPGGVGGIRLDWWSGEEALLDRMQDALLHDGTRAELLAYLHLQDADESIQVDEQAVRVDPATWGTVPHTYVRLTADRALPLALQDRFVAEADAATPHNPFDVRSIATSHLGVQVHPGQLVKLLADLAPLGLTPG